MTSTTLIRQVVAPTVSRRAFSVSSVSRAEGAHHGHGHGHGETAGSAASETNESFFSPFWRNTFLITGLAIISFPFLPSPSSAVSSPSLDSSYSTPSSSSSSASETNNESFITKQLRKWTPESKTWTERNEKHLDLAIKAAEDRLLFQEAERPRIHRLRFPAAFEAGSPNCVAVGSQADLSDLVVKGDQKLEATTGAQQ